MIKVLIITYYWPPSGGSGVQRVLKFSKYLPEYGLQPIILTVKNGEYPAIDNTFEKDIPKNCIVYKTNSLEPNNLYRKLTGMKKEDKIPVVVLSDKNVSWKKKILHWIRLNLFIPDAKIGWIPFAVNEGKKIIKLENPDIIFSSSPPPTVHLIANKLAKWSKIKWVADFRDPWADRFDYVASNRSRLTRWLDEQLEKKVLKKANWITAVTPGFQKLLDSKWSIISKSSILYNGFDNQDFDRLKYEKGVKDYIAIVHIGSLSKSQNPLRLIQSVKLYNESHMQKPIIIKFIGYVHPDIYKLVKIEKLEVFFEILPYLDHEKAVEEMANSDYLLLVVPDLEKNEGIVPSKLFEYFRSRSEIILVGNKESDAAKLMIELGYNYIYNFDESINFTNLIPKEHYVEKLISKFERRKLTKDLANIFRKVLC